MTDPRPPAPAPPPAASAAPPGTPVPPPAASAGDPRPPAPATGRPLPSPFVAVVGYTIRACLPAKRWWGVLLLCLGAVVIGWLARLPDTAAPEAFGIVARHGLFGLVLPLTCLIIGDAVLGADVRAGTFPLTWLSPVPFHTIVIGRWLGGWLVSLVTLVPALVTAVFVAGFGDTARAMVVAGAAGAAAYIGLFVMLGVVTRRSAAWFLAVVFLGERLLGGVLAGIAQISPMWEAQQVYAGLDADRWRPWCEGVYDAGCLLRAGTPNGWVAVLRLAIVLVVTLAVATWRLGRLQPTGGDE